MPKPRIETVPIYDGEDFERITDLRRAVEVAQRQATSGARRVGDDDGVQAAKDAYDAFVLEAADRAEMWAVRPIGHAEFRTLLRQHPPRRVAGTDDLEVEDAAFGVNVDTFGQALLTFVDPENTDDEDEPVRTVVSPELGEAGLHKRLKQLSAGEFDSLWVLAYQLNTGGVADPKASLYSTDSHSSSVT